MYQMLPAGEYPNTAAVAPHLYGSLEEQFAYGLDRLLDGLGIARDVEPPADPWSAGSATHSYPWRDGNAGYENEREDRSC